MMFLKLIVVVFVLAACKASDSGPEKSKSNRQKRLLFYDEDGNLVKTYKTPYSLDFIHNAEKTPFFGSFMNIFRPATLGVPTFYMIPVSDQVIQQINSDPMYQNKLLTLPRKEMIVEPNTQCSGKRTQIPAKSCRNFLNCWDGWAFEQECPEGLLFAKEGYCDYPQNVDCASRTNSPIPETTNPQCMKDFEAFRSDQNCNEFFICVDRSPVKFRCPADLAYNQELGVCDYAYRVNCQSGIQAPAMDEIQPSPPVDQPIIQPIVPIIPAVQPDMPTTQPDGQPSNQPVQQPAFPCSPAFDKMPIIPAPQMPSGAASAAISSGDSPVGKSILTTNSEFKSHTFSSSHVAISRHDAIRQLKLGPTDNNK